MKYMLLIVGFMCANLYAITFRPINDSKGTSKVLKIPHLRKTINLDGNYNEKEWEGALELSLNYEVEPGENIAPIEQTKVFMFYSNSKIYIAIKAYDSNPSEIRAHYSDRDKLGGDDWVGVVFDTFNDQRRAYDFICNPYGIQQDAVESANSFDTGWNSIWYSEGKITDFGYVVEMAIPFNSIRFQNMDDAQSWGIDFMRVIPRNSRHKIGFFPRDRNNSCYLCQTPKLVGFEGITTSSNVELAPTMSYQKNHSREDKNSGPFKLRQDKLDPGVSAKWGITSNITLNATLNPDFSQVETDALQLNENSQFALSYPERRPFFVEASDFFQTPTRAVYTRSVREPLWGVKATGKEGSHSVGVYLLQDEKTNIIFPDSDGSNNTSLDQNSYSTILRYKKDYGNYLTVGGVATGRKSKKYENALYGVDVDYRVSRKDRITVQLLNTETSYSDSIAIKNDQSLTPISGYSIYTKYKHDSKNLDYRVGYTEFHKNFRADMGYVPQVDYRKGNGGIEYMIFPKTSNPIWERLAAGISGAWSETLSKRFLKANAETSLSYRGPFQSSLYMQLSHVVQDYRENMFRMNKVFTFFRIKPMNGLSIQSTASYGEGIDYRNTRKGNSINTSHRFELNFGKHFSAKIRYTYSNFKIVANNLYTVNLLEPQFVYQFTKRCFVRAIFQYQHKEYNLPMYLEDNRPSQELTESLNAQYLLSYKVNPQSMVFVGYSDRYYSDNDLEARQTDKAFFMKLGYALVL